MRIKPLRTFRALLSCTFLLAGCADSRLAAAPPAGVNLSGEWVLDQGLSDDRESVAQLEKTVLHAHSNTASGEPPADEDRASPYAPRRMRIEQEGAHLTLQAPDSSSDLCAGPVCHMGWRGPVFVVDTQTPQGRELQKSYALDTAGHLIVTVQAGKVGVTLAYDRERS